MRSKRGPSENSASPNKRRKSATNDEPKQHSAFYTRMIPSLDSHKQQKDETEPEPLIAELDESLDQASYVVKPAAWDTIKRYKRFSSRTRFNLNT
jgi:hypothetical protein